MTSSRPYLIRAIYEWILDNGCTPYIVVDAEAEGVSVPTQYIQDGKIILNIAPQAVKSLQLQNDWVMFSARFSGVLMEIAAPVGAVVAIYAKENGRGMVFGDEEQEEGDGLPPPDRSGDGELTSDQPRKGKPNLKIVK